MSRASFPILARMRRIFPPRYRRALPRQIQVIRVDERTARTLNRVYRARLAPGSVLSFRYGDSYGELILCPAVIRREARAQGTTYVFQMTWMIVHGMLHLAGVHHERSKYRAVRFEKLEREIIGSLFPENFQ